MAAKITVMDYDQAHEFVERQPAARWNGWAIELFTPSVAAWMKPKGVRRDNKWGFLTTVQVNGNGEYEVPTKFVK
jgi:hypothetical protein